MDTDTLSCQEWQEHYKSPCFLTAIHEHGYFPPAIEINKETKHFSEGKLGIHWILAIKELDYVAQVGDYGAVKYDRENWRKGTNWMEFFGSILRHTTQALRGDWYDKESGLPHLAHVIFNCLILLHYYQHGKGTDDRPKQ